MENRWKYLKFINAAPADMILKLFPDGPYLLRGDFCFYSFNRVEMLILAHVATGIRLFWNT